jgi:hypothetical protein
MLDNLGKERGVGYRKWFQTNFPPTSAEGRGIEIITSRSTATIIINHGQSNDNPSSSFRLYSFDIPANQDQDISKQKNDKSHYY